MPSNFPYHALVADDEAPSQNYVCELIKQDPRFEVVAVCDSGPATVAAAASQRLDILFLDVQMPGMGGFEVMEAIQADRPLVVFVTAHGDYALRAFEYEAFDYVKKPIDPARFSRILDRLHERLVEMAAPIGVSTEGNSDLPVDATSERPGQQEVRLLNAVRQDLLYREYEVEYVESAGNYVNVRIRGESYLVRETMDSFCRSLKSTDLIRVHRSYLVNVQWVRSIKYGKFGSAELQLAGGYVIPVSRTRRQEVAELLQRLSQRTSGGHEDFAI